MNQQHRQVKTEFNDEISWKLLYALESNCNGFKMEYIPYEAED